MSLNDLIGQIQPFVLECARNGVVTLPNGEKGYYNDYIGELALIIREYNLNLAVDHSNDEVITRLLEYLLNFNFYHLFTEEDELIIEE